MHDKDRVSLEGELRRYFLGQMTQQEEETFNRRLMAGSDEFLHKVDEIADLLNDELVEDYTSKKLSSTEKAAFETHLLPSAKIAEKLILDKALRVAAGRKKTSVVEFLRAWVQPVLQPAPLALCTSLLLVVGWSFHSVALLQDRLGEAASSQTSMTAARESLRSQINEERRKNDALARELAAALPARGMSSGAGIVAVASFILKPGSTRGSGQTTRVAISPGQILVELKLDLGIDDHRGYRAALYDSGDNELLTASHLRAVRAGSTVHVPVQLPAQVLRADDYQIRLSGAASSGGFSMIDSYPFRVVRR